MSDIGGIDLTRLLSSSWTAQTDMIETTTLGVRPDETWEHIDSNGHAVTWATAQFVETDRWTVYDEDETYEDYEGEYRCPACGEVVEPRWTSDPARSFVPAGLSRMTGTLEIDLHASTPELGAILNLPMGSDTVRAIVTAVRATDRAWIVEVARTG